MYRTANTHSYAPHSDTLLPADLRRLDSALADPSTLQRGSGRRDLLLSTAAVCGLTVDISHKSYTDLQVNHVENAAANRVESGRKRGRDIIGEYGFCLNAFGLSIGPKPSFLNFQRPT